MDGFASPSQSVQSQRHPVMRRRKGRVHVHGQLQLRNGSLIMAGKVKNVSFVGVQKWRRGLDIERQFDGRVSFSFLAEEGARHRIPVLRIDVASLKLEGALE